MGRNPSMAKPDLAVPVRMAGFLLFLSTTQQRSLHGDQISIVGDMSR
jgi:hypothetical protein